MQKSSKLLLRPISICTLQIILIFSTWLLLTTCYTNAVSYPDGSYSAGSYSNTYQDSSIDNSNNVNNSTSPEHSDTSNPTPSEHGDVSNITNNPREATNPTTTKPKETQKTPIGQSARTVDAIIFATIVVLCIIAAIFLLKKISHQKTNTKFINSTPPKETQKNKSNNGSVQY